MKIDISKENMKRSVMRLYESGWRVQDRDELQKASNLTDEEANVLIEELAEYQRTEITKTLSALLDNDSCEIPIGHFFVLSYEKNVYRDGFFCDRLMLKLNVADTLIHSAPSVEISSRDYDGIMKELGTKIPFIIEEVKDDAHRALNVALDDMK